MAHTVAWSHGGEASSACQRQVMLAFPQGDVLITSCTYNTEDRELATVVSHPRFPFHLPRESVQPGLSEEGGQVLTPHLGHGLIPSISQSFSAPAP